MSVACVGVDTTTDNSLQATTVYLLRHTEKATNGQSDPPLTNTGQQRARYWANVLGDIKFDAIYSTDTSRTRDTAKPVADANTLKITLYRPRQLTRETILTQHSGQTILVVGHSNTTARLSNQLLAQERFADLSDDEYSVLFIVTLHGESASAQKLRIDQFPAD